ncbi:MAG: T9SS type A sorting domain-containing protein, partial [Muribaculaceae bacterium]|nr:T9SS type A sorting domain-containing protein [Muribaculaceae bacterium]
EAEFYVPASVDEGQIYKTVTLGEKYPVKKATSANGDDLDNFWSLPIEHCLPFMRYKATLNLSDMTIVFTEGNQTYIPEHLYITGSASPSLWNQDMVEMESEGNGVFSYRGNLYMGEMRFLDIPDFGNAISYVPYYGGTHIIDTSAQIVQIKGEPGRNWWVPDYGEWNIRVEITDGGTKVSVTAEHLGDMTPQVYALGHATGTWDCLWPTYSSYILPTEKSPNVFVWEGTLAPHTDGNGVEQRQHLKFIKYPKAWNEGCVFYVPTERDSDFEHAKTVNVGDKLPVDEVTSDNCKDGQLDWFWGFPQDKCTPDNLYRVTLDLNNKTIEFADARGGTDQLADVAASEMKAGFIGGDLVVEGAASAIAVYDIAGRLLATSASGSLTVTGLPAGVYVVKTAEAAVKIVK